jgi:predicted CopG family antitoxin
MGNTTIQISDEVKKMLDKKKLGEKESYDEVLKRILKVKKIVSKDI